VSDGLAITWHFFDPGNTLARAHGLLVVFTSMATTIDEATYQLKHVLKCSKGSGDNKEEFSFTVLTGPDDHEFWLLNERNDWWLFRRPPDGTVRFEVANAHEEFFAQRFERDGVDEGPKRLTWAAFTEPYQNAPAPFQGTTEGLLFGGTDSRDMMLSIPLMMTEPDVFYTPSFPASQMSRVAVTPRAGLGGGPVVKHFALILGIVFAVSALLGVTNPIKMLWWMGPLAVIARHYTTQQSTLNHALRLLAAVFFLHFSTYVFDHAVALSVEEAGLPLYESVKVALLCIALWGVRLWNPRYYFAVVDGVTWGGGCAWLLFCGGLTVATLFDEVNLFNWFRWYAGTLPWSLLWIVGAAAGIHHKLKDYSKAPLDLRGFRSLLYRTAETLEQKLEHSRSKAGSLGEWADDLGDALAISTDPLVVSLVDYAPAFKALREQAQKLADVDVKTLEPASKAHLDADLTTIAEDCRAMISCLDRWPESRADFTLLRRSPRLVLWGK
jgi:hypothetical protein